MQDFWRERMRLRGRRRSAIWLMVLAAIFFILVICLGP
jgi:hypothetical protein